MQLRSALVGRQLFEVQTEEGAHVVKALLLPSKVLSGCLNLTGERYVVSNCETKLDEVVFDDCALPVIQCLYSIDNGGPLRRELAYLPRLDIRQVQQQRRIWVHSKTGHDGMPSNWNEIPVELCVQPSSSRFAFIAKPNAEPVAAWQ